MRLVRTEDAVGHVLCHDMTQIVTGEESDGPRFKGPRFRKGHVVAPEDVPVLLSMGKRSLYVWELEPGMVHEDDAAERMVALVAGPGTRTSGAPSEGKINVLADRDGVLLVDSARLSAVNAVDEVMVATRRGGFPVREGDLLAGTRVIPLVISEGQLARAEAAAGDEPLVRVEPFRLRTAAVIATGSEVAAGLIEDRFTPVMVEKLAAYGIETVLRSTPGDDREDVVAAIDEARSEGVDLIMCTGGMSVDPDDNTPGAIRAAGARVVTRRGRLGDDARGEGRCLLRIRLLAYARPRAFRRAVCHDDRRSERLAQAGGRGRSPGHRRERAAHQERLRGAGGGRPVPRMPRVHVPALPLWEVASFVGYFIWGGQDTLQMNFERCPGRLNETNGVILGVPLRKYPTSEREVPLILR